MLCCAENLVKLAQQWCLNRLLKIALIEIVTQHRHLSVVISKDLKWYHHVQEVIGKLSWWPGLLRWLAHDLPIEAASKLYLFYVCLVCEYASLVWHWYLRADQALFLERIQAGVAWRLLNASCLTSKLSLLQSLDWPSLRWRREIASITLLHSLVHTRPSPLSDALFPFSSTVCPHRNHRKPYQLVIDLCQNQQPA